MNDEQNKKEDLVFWEEVREVKANRPTPKTTSGYLYLPKKLIGLKVLVKYEKNIEETLK